MVEHGNKNLTQRATTSSIWMMAARLTVRFSDLLLLMLLTRILSPEDFGLVAIATSIMAILDLITDLPIVTPLVRLEAPEKRHMDTAFALSLLRALAIFAMIWALSGSLAAFYGDERLVNLLLALAAGSAAYGLRSPRLAILFKRLQFRQSFMIEVGGKLVGVMVAAAIAISTQAYWALVVSPIVSRVVSSGLSYVHAPYRPGVSLSEWRMFWDFLGWMFPAQIVVAVSWQFDRLFLGRVIPIDLLGFYGIASNVTSILEQTVRRAVNAPLTSGFVLIGQDYDRLRRGYLLADHAIFALGAPVYMITFFWADTLVRLAFGEDWLTVAPFLAGLALARVPALLRVPFRPLAMAVGNTWLIFQLAVISISIRIPVVALGYLFGGVPGVIIGIGLGNVFDAAAAMYLVRRLIALDWRAQITPVVRTAVMMVPLIAFCGVLGAIMEKMPTDLNLLLMFVAACLGSLAIYAATVFISWSASGRPDGIESRLHAKLKTLWARLAK